MEELSTMESLKKLSLLHKRPFQRKKRLQKVSPSDSMKTASIAEDHLEILSSSSDQGEGNYKFQNFKEDLVDYSKRALTKFLGLVGGVHYAESIFEVQSLLSSELSYVVQMLSLMLKRFLEMRSSEAGC